LTVVYVVVHLQVLVLIAGAGSRENVLVKGGGRGWSSTWSPSQGRLIEHLASLGFYYYNWGKRSGIIAT
jgi:hypothetical protein